MSSHDPFEFFGLDRKSATLAELKTAYAQRLKTTRPDEDRDGFMALRDAFEGARREIEWREQYGDDDDGAWDEEGWEEEERDDSSGEQELHAAEADTSSPVLDDIEPLDENAAPQIEPVESGFEPQVSAVDQAMEDIEALTKSPFASSSFKPWEAILERDDLQPIDEYQDFSNRLRWFVCNATGYNSEEQVIDTPPWLSMAVFKGLCEHFSWHRSHSTDQWVAHQTQWLYRLDQHLTTKEDAPEVEQRMARRARRKGKSAPDIKNDSRLFETYEPARPEPLPKQSRGSLGFSPWKLVVFVFLIYSFIRSMGSA